jgi:hypothetical protein
MASLIALLSPAQVHAQMIGCMVIMRVTHHYRLWQIVPKKLPITGTGYSILLFSNIELAMANYSFKGSPLFSQLGTHCVFVCNIKLRVAWPKERLVGCNFELEFVY